MVIAIPNWARAPLTKTLDEPRPMLTLAPVKAVMTSAGQEVDAPVEVRMADEVVLALFVPTSAVSVDGVKLLLPDGHQIVAPSFLSSYTLIPGDTFDVRWKFGG